MESWITCPILYRALKSKKKPEDCGPVSLGPDYNIRQIGKKDLEEKVNAYFDSTVLFTECSRCKEPTRWDLLKRHMPFSSYHQKCHYKLCDGCFRAELKLVTNKHRKEGRLPCPFCRLQLCFYQLTGQRASTALASKK
jgi:hypothetical protein